MPEGGQKLPKHATYIIE